MFDAMYQHSNKQVKENFNKLVEAVYAMSHDNTIDNSAKISRNDTRWKINDTELYGNCSQVIQLQNIVREVVR